MSSLEISKILGALVVVAFAIVSINTVREALRGVGVTEDSHHPAKVTATAAQVAKPAGKPAVKPDAGPQPIAPLLAAASEDKGRQVFKKCAACHSVDEGGKSKVGPNLWNIVNARAGNRQGFNYSAALQGFSSKWTYENLNKFLARPKSFLPGTRMGFAGLKKGGDRANVIRYLRSLSKSPAPLP